MGGNAYYEGYQRSHCWQSPSRQSPSSHPRISILPPCDLLSLLLLLPSLSPSPLLLLSPLVFLILLDLENDEIQLGPRPH